MPTSTEKRHLDSLVTAAAEQGSQVALCGFGPIAAAAMTSRLLAKHRPSRVLLVGIAGSYDESISCGDAVAFCEAACQGVGVGDGKAHQNATTMGWPMLESPRVNNRIKLSGATENVLLTCCAASDSVETAQTRRQFYPDAVAEDMEGFSVALSCKLFNTPVTIIRGISNLAGDRDHANWKIELALASATELAMRWLREKNDD